MSPPATVATQTYCRRSSLFTCHRNILSGHDHVGNGDDDDCVGDGIYDNATPVEMTMTAEVFIFPIVACLPMTPAIWNRGEKFSLGRNNIEVGREIISEVGGK